MLDTLLSTILLTLANSITIIALKAVNNNYFHMHSDSTLYLPIPLPTQKHTENCCCYTILSDRRTGYPVYTLICHLSH